LQYEEKTMISSLLDAFAVIEELLPRWSILGSILDRGQLLQPREHSCGVGQDYLVIDQRGGVSKCHMEIERTLGDIFSDDPLQLVRRDESTVLNLPVAEKEGCRDFTWRHWLLGWLRRRHVPGDRPVRHQVAELQHLQGDLPGSTAPRRNAPAQIRAPGLRGPRRSSL
jgi:hypothetical protein